MKRVWGCLMVSILLLVLVVPSSYAEKNLPGDRMGKSMQGPCPEMIPPPADCKMPGMPEGGNPGWPKGPLETLNLDDRQKEALKEIEGAMLKERIRKGADGRIAEIELRELLEKETVDLKAVEAKIKKISVMKGEAQLAAIQSVEKMKALLTPEQRIQLKKAQHMNPRSRPPRQNETMCDDDLSVVP